MLPRNAAIAIPILAFAIGTAPSASFAAARADSLPAARAHVRYVDGVWLKYSSKLTTVVELNFTFGNGHLEGKQVIDAALSRIAKEYGTGGKDAFAIKRFASSNSGAAVGEQVRFGLEDLLAGEVIVANNLSYLPQILAKNPAEAAALEDAIKVGGRAVLSFHGSGDGGKEWPFYANELHPLNYHGMSYRTNGPVYKDPAMERHIVLQGVLETGTTLAEVPTGTDPFTGAEVLATGVKTRLMKNEWYQYPVNILADRRFQGKVTSLLKFDARNLGDAFPAQYRYAGGNAFSFLLRVGAGIAGYIQSGHSDDELTARGTSFDGGTGDFDRYVAQMLFFLAGYATAPCMGAECDGLAIVSADGMLTGRVLERGGSLAEPGRLGFTTTSDESYEAKLADVRGRILSRKSGVGRIEYEFDRTGLRAGVYFLSVKIGKAPAKVRRYLVAGDGAG